MQEEARLSKLVFLDTDKDEEPQWKFDSVPSLLGGWRSYHASVVVKNKETDQQIVVVIGGSKSSGQTNSVLSMNLGKDKKQWKEAPNLNQKRSGHAAVVCNGFVYVLGGYDGSSRLDSIERIYVDDLLETTCTTNKKQWTTLNCRLSTTRNECAAAVVHDRFIVVAGGYNGRSLSSTEIVDTVVKTQHTVIAGPSMKVARHSCSMAVVDRRIFVIGGCNGSPLNSVEYLDFNEDSLEKNETAGFNFPSSSEWTIHKDLVLSVPRRQYAVFQVGSCVIVSGGLSLSRHSLKSVEILDTERNVNWNLPDMTTARNGPSMVSVPDGIVVTGGHELDSSETLPLIDMKEHIKSMYSCRAELDAKIQTLTCAIERGHKERRNVNALEEAIEAKSLLPLMEWLRDHDEKFRSVQELEESIDQLDGELQEIDVLEGCLPIARKIEALEEFVAKNKKVKYERNHAGQNSEDESESGWVMENETLSVSGHATVELSGDFEAPQDQIFKLEDMIVEQRIMTDQLSGRVRLLENTVLGKNET